MSTWLSRGGRAKVHEDTDISGIALIMLSLSIRSSCFLLYLRIQALLLKRQKECSLVGAHVKTVRKENTTSLRKVSSLWLTISVD